MQPKLFRQPRKTMGQLQTRVVPPSSVWLLLSWQQQPFTDAPSCKTVAFEMLSCLPASSISDLVQCPYLTAPPRFNSPRTDFWALAMFGCSCNTGSFSVLLVFVRFFECYFSSIVLIQHTFHFGSIPPGGTTLDTSYRHTDKPFRLVFSKVPYYLLYIRYLYTPPPTRTADRITLFDPMADTYCLLCYCLF